MAKKALLSGALILTPVGGILAQDGMTATFRFTEQLEYVDEKGYTTPRDEGFRAVSLFDFDLSSQNANQRFGFGLGGGLVYNFNSDISDGFELEDPSARLSYGIENRRSALNFDADYRRRDVDDTDFLDDNGLVSADEGTRTLKSLRTGLELGRDAPIGLDLNYLYADVAYSDTLDPTLLNNITQDLQGRLNFRLSGVASAYLFSDWRDLDEEGPTGNDRTTQTTGIGGTYQVSPVLEVNGQLSYTDITSTNSGDTDGMGYSLGATHAMPNGSLGGSISSEETINGTRTTAEISRVMTLKRGTASFGLGASKLGSLSLEPLVRADVSMALSEVSDLRLNVSQRSVVNNNDDETIRTQVGVNYSRTLTALSSISSGLQYADQNVISGSGVDQSTLSFDVTYRHAVGDEWDLVSGYRFTSSRRDDRDDRDNNTLFVGLEKTFSFRP